MSFEPFGGCAGCACCLMINCYQFLPYRLLLWLGYIQAPSGSIMSLYRPVPPLYLLNPRAQWLFCNWPTVRLLTMLGPDDIPSNVQMCTIRLFIAWVNIVFGVSSDQGCPATWPSFAGTHSWGRLHCIGFSRREPLYCNCEALTLALTNNRSHSMHSDFWVTLPAITDIAASLSRSSVFPANCSIIPPLGTLWRMGIYLSSSSFLVSGEWILWNLLCQLTDTLYAELRGSWALDARDIITGNDPKRSRPRNYRQYTPADYFVRMPTLNFAWASVHQLWCICLRYAPWIIFPVEVSHDGA